MMLALLNCGFQDFSLRNDRLAHRRASTVTGNRPMTLPTAGQTIWRDKLSQLLESTGEGIFGIDMDGCCTFLNRAGAEQLG
jgi:PAS domain-containing protein